MMYTEIYNKVKEHFILHNNIERFNHSIRVMEMALKLNQIHGLNLDINKLQVAAILHDYAKVIDKNIQKELILKKYPNDLELLNYEPIWHSLIGDVIIKKDLNIFDEDILDAVVYHTIGRPEMNDMTKVIFLADYIEEGRTHKEAEMVRNIAYRNLNQAIIEMIECSLKYLNNKGYPIYYKTLETYKYYKEGIVNVR